MSLFVAVDVSIQLSFDAREIDKDHVGSYTDTGFGRILTANSAAIGKPEHAFFTCELLRFTSAFGMVWYMEFRSEPNPLHNSKTDGR